MEHLQQDVEAVSPVVGLEDKLTNTIENGENEIDLHGALGEDLEEDLMAGVMTTTTTRTMRTSGVAEVAGSPRAGQGVAETLTTIENRGPSSSPSR